MKLADPLPSTDYALTVCGLAAKSVRAAMLSISPLLRADFCKERAGFCKGRAGYWQK